MHTHIHAYILKVCPTVDFVEGKPRTTLMVGLWDDGVTLSGASSKKTLKPNMQAVGKDVEGRCACVCVYVYIYIYIYIVHVFVYVHTYTYIHTYINTYIHTYIHTYIYIHIHTYIHTHTGGWSFVAEKILNGQNRT